MTIGNKLSDTLGRTYDIHVLKDSNISRILATVYITRSVACVSKPLRNNAYTRFLMLWIVIQFTDVFEKLGPKVGDKNLKEQQGTLRPS